MTKKTTNDFETHWKDIGDFKVGDVVYDVYNTPVPLNSQNHLTVDEPVRTRRFGKLGSKQLTTVVKLTGDGFAIPKKPEANGPLFARPTLHEGSIVSILAFLSSETLDRIRNAIGVELDRRVNGQNMICLICGERTQLVEGAYECKCGGKIKVPGL